jgi:hypothetical protein
MLKVPTSAHRTSVFELGLDLELFIVQLFCATLELGGQRNQNAFWLCVGMHWVHDLM